MNKTFLVMKNELSIIFSRLLFLIFAFGIPILIVLIMGGIKLFRSESAESTSSEISSQTPDHLATEGYLDHSGLIQIIPEGFEDPDEAFLSGWLPDIL